ncbi:AlkA N-terminal domain-containing protein [Actinophytocola algeriensis]|uniref:AraC family transcriptional regulator of adaptative response / DNA-3-methyladenine glycosylase II n=1 Tax=Actinophytocola algeriensis TaxID=1768010 RepID=A0A7W7Q5Q0_9PSEU|nr:AlkA N-terminal domain-containing protein [Actinophytocola algeriensis]MBB4907525.1 AraC family transcriptional regulator of adaptative response / DNA-3-methyladenine glycosylase II [Actinophytocola algeriensis]MBE1479555.1 AraC family transcriptional regulator of adaptative response / DNA-3-methyladenine glycosylase II [Actinophytocola algeriensis]
MTTYSAVRTTGIYCRPGCGAKPNAENVRTFEHPAAAEAAGYRACLRCRPYRVAGTVADEAPEIVCRAVRLIIDGVLDEGTEAALGARLGVSARHLRRMFHDHLGVTPDGFARSRRAHFARRMLDDTELPVADVAFASGFGSLRQFNRTMREVFRATPKELRARRRRADRLTADGGLLLRLPFTQPYDWPAVAAFLALRAIPGIESVVDGVYRRTVVVDGEPGMLELGPGGADHLLLRAHLPYWEGVIHVVARAARLSGVDFDPLTARTELSRDPVLGPLVAARPGVRVPGVWTPFEVAVRAAVGAAGAADLAVRYGVEIPGLGHGLTHVFPSPSTLAETAEPVADLAKAMAAGEDPQGMDPDAAAHFALRTGARDAFPAGDPAIRSAVRDLSAAPGRWQPWRSLATVHLMLRN